MIEEPEEEQITLPLELYISYEESTMAKDEGEGEVHNLNGEALRIAGGRRGGGRGRGRGEENRRRENREDHNSIGFPIVDGDTNATMKNISPSILPNLQ